MKKRWYGFNVPIPVSEVFEKLVKQSNLNRTAYLITLIAKEARELNITQEIKPKENLI